MQENVLAQARAVREGCGFLDRSGMGKLAIRGADRYTWLQGMVSNDTRLLASGNVFRLPACILDATGHLLSDMALFAIPGEEPYLLMELPPANVARIAETLDRFLIIEDVEVEAVTGAIGCLSLQGPKAEAFLAAMGESALLRCAADHTGSGGMDVLFPMAERGRRREALRAAGVVEVGAEAQEMLRVEAGIPQYGVDMDESVLALEANLGPTHISRTKGCYVGQEIVARIEARGHTNRALTGLRLEGETLPAPGEKLFAPPGEEPAAWRETGRITSVLAVSPAAGGLPIALGYARHEHRAPGARLRVGEEGRGLSAIVTELPFFRKSSA